MKTILSPDSAVGLDSKRHFWAVFKQIFDELMADIGAGDERQIARKLSWERCK
jgi:hypothetical protein